MCHLSLPRSVELARWYADSGTSVSVETCPHYLAFTVEDMIAHGGRLKINPPLRTADDVEGLWAHLREGSIDTIGSDHAPWPLSDKTHLNVFDNRSGVPGVETLFAVVANGSSAREGIGLDDLVRTMSSRPAELFGLGDRKGRLAPGYDADIVAFDPDRSWVVDETQLHSNAGWSPYHGMELTGRVVLTVAGGEVVWDGNDVVARPGRGRVLEPSNGQLMPPARRLDLA